MIFDLIYKGADPVEVLALCASWTVIGFIFGFILGKGRKRK